MSSLFSRTLLICASAILAACASAPELKFDAAPKPPVVQDKATVYVIRNDGYIASWIATDIYVDNVKVGGVREGTFTWFQVTPGKHVFGATFGWGSTPELAKEYDFKAGTTTYVVLDSKIITANLYSKEFRAIEAAEALPLLQRYTYRPAQAQAASR